MQSQLIFHSALALTLTVSCGASLAMETWQVTMPDGSPFVSLHVYTEDEPFAFDAGDDYAGTSDYNFTSNEKAMIYQGFDYLERLLQHTVNYESSLMVVAIGQYDDNATALSLASAAYPGLTDLGAELLYGVQPPTLSTNSSLISIDHATDPRGWYVGPMQNLPDNGDLSDLSSTLTHEMFHALGIQSQTNDEDFASVNDVPVETIDGFSYALVSFSDNLTYFSLGLRDLDGTAAQPGMQITLNGGTAQASDDTFDLTADWYGESGVYFTGAHVQEVLNGAWLHLVTQGIERDTVVPGLPINGWEYSGSDLEDGTSLLIPDLSHIELLNSLMSHQSYRSWNTLLEAELAVLQDIGYTIDRRDWFGYSVYNEGATIVNRHPFYARNAAGTTFLTGVPNDNPWGVGLHVYGSHNHITQAADILSVGAYGIGMRIDGWDNTMVVAPETTVLTAGQYGTALLVSYGTDHHIIHEGTLVADGENGVGALFSFGDNEMSNATEYRGSFIHEERSSGEEEDLLNNLEKLGLAGALVNDFDVAGNIVGTRAAIEIDETALVSNINVMQGATISGDIISGWQPDAVYAALYAGSEQVRSGEVDITPADMVTELNFGLRAHADGSASNRADPDFALHYAGDIHDGYEGPAAINFNLIGGYLSYDGTARVYDVYVEDGATLGGNGSYELASGYTFTNNGTIAPGNSIGSISIDGPLVMGATGRLALEFDAQGHSDHLVLSQAPDLAELNGAPFIYLQAASGYYSAALPLDLSDLITVRDGTWQVSDQDVALVSLQQASPTLYFTVGNSSDGDAYLTVQAERAPDAYSRYARSDAGREVAQVFDNMAANAPLSMQEIVTDLDFSAPDGSELEDAFVEMSPALYAQAGAASLHAQQVVTSSVRNGLTGKAPFAVGQNEFYLQPLGGYIDRDAEDIDSTYSGFVVGAQRSTAVASGQLTYGLHAAALHHKDEFDGAHSGKATADSFYFGASVRHDFNDELGNYLFAVAQVGMDNTDFEREVRGSTLESDWTAWVASLSLGWGQSFSVSTNLSMGPLLWVDYSVSHLPAVTESGATGVELHTQDELLQSLRSALGWRCDYQLPSESFTGALSFALAWSHEYRDDYGDVSASFVQWDRQSFSAAAEVETCDTVLASIGFNAQFTPSFAAKISATLQGGDGLLGGGGELSLKWSF